MSKTAQRNQSAFNVGQKIGVTIARKFGSIDSKFFTFHFRNLYKGAKCFQTVVRKAARIGYANELDKAAKAAYLKNRDTQLTGGKDAKL